MVRICFNSSWPTGCGSSPLRFLIFSLESPIIEHEKKTLYCSLEEFLSVDAQKYPLYATRLAESTKAETT